MLAVGVASGFYYGSRYYVEHALAFDGAEIIYYSAFVDTQMIHGTDASLEEAIHDFLKIIETRKAHPSKLLSKKVLTTDAALSNARLAALAQKRGATQESQQYLNRAASLCPQLGWNECSAEKIISVVHKLDKLGTFKTGETK